MCVFVCDFPHGLSLGDRLINISAVCWKEMEQTVCMLDRGRECVHLSAFSLAGSCHWKRLHSKLSETKGNEQLENRTALAGLIWIRPKLHKDHSELWCVHVCVWERDAGDAFLVIQRVYYSNGVKIMTGFSLSKKHYK